MKFCFSYLFHLSIYLACSRRVVLAWEWSDFLPTRGSSSKESPLSIQEVSELRVRQIKRLLTRRHGYSAEELGRMLEKKELIHALAYEEEKLRLRGEADARRYVLVRAVAVAVVAVVVVACWPLLRHAYDVVAINFVVYMDRKRHEVAKCREFQSWGGMVGVTAMLLIDVLQAWLTVSIVLSWFMKSKYFFPMPSLPINPGQLLGGEVAKSQFSRYGINVAPMIVTWLLRFLHGRVEKWTGLAMSKALRARQRERREHESPKERSARRAARSQANRQQSTPTSDLVEPEYSSTGGSMPSAEIPSSLPPGWMQPLDADSVLTAFLHPNSREDARHTGIAEYPDSSTHQEFIQQIEAHTSELDDLD